MRRRFLGRVQKVSYQISLLGLSDMNFHCLLIEYIRTSIAQTPMTRLPWLFRTRFRVTTKFFRKLKKQIFKGIFLFYHEIVCCVYSLKSHHRGDSNEYHQHTIIV